MVLGTFLASMRPCAIRAIGCYAAASALAGCMRTARAVARVPISSTRRGTKAVRGATTSVELNRIILRPLACGVEMSEFWRSFQGWYFNSGVETLSRSYTTAARALFLELDQAKSNLSGYLDDIAGGAEPDREVDEDGLVLSDRETLLEMEIENVYEAAMGLRKAFAIQFYHFWERSAQNWTGCDTKAGFRSLKAAVHTKGFDTHPKLDAVLMLANTLKHGSTDYGPRLFAAWPEIVVLPFARDVSKVSDWYAAVVLSDPVIFEIAEIIRASGPQLRRG